MITHGHTAQTSLPTNLNAP